MFTSENKCICKGMLIGLSIGMTAGFLTHMLTSSEKPKFGLKKKAEKVLKAAESLLGNL